MKKYYRYGIAAEKAHFEEHVDAYHGLIFPAHITVDQESSLPVFAQKLQKPYIVDPMTYVFGLESSIVANERGDELRRSWGKLRSRYSEGFPTNLPPGEFLHGSRLRPPDFRTEGELDTSKLSGFVEAVVDVQTILTSPDPTLTRYQTMLNEEETELSLSFLTHQPEYFISPYFFWRSYEDPRYELNAGLASATVDTVEEGPVAGVIAVERSFLTSGAQFSRILDDFGGLDAYFLWVDSFNEFGARIDELKAFGELVSALSADGAEVVSLYGGGFSALLAPVGMAGVSSGLCYGERKSKDASGGGGAIPDRYFVRDAFLKLTRADLAGFLAQVGPSCLCEICSDARERSRARGYVGFLEEFFPPGRSGDDDRLKGHFMLALDDELRSAEGKSAGDLAETIRHRSSMLREQYRIFHLEQAQHLDHWAAALDSL